MCLLSPSLLVGGLGMLPPPEELRVIALGSLNIVLILEGI